MTVKVVSGLGQRLGREQHGVAPWKQSMYGDIQIHPAEHPHICCGEKLIQDLVAHFVDLAHMLDIRLNHLERTKVNRDAQ